MNGISGATDNTNILAKALAVAIIIAIAVSAAAFLRYYGLGRDQASYYEVRSYGARGNGLNKNTQSAIDAAASYLSGTAIFPPGRYSRTPLLESQGADTRNVEVVTGHGTCQGGSGFEVCDRTLYAPLGGYRLVLRDSYHSSHPRRSSGGVRVQPHLGS